MVDYSIVVPVYFNEGLLEYTADQIFSKVFASVPDKKGEIVFVDDGSKDGSLKELLGVLEKHRGQVRILKHSRNFGQANAWWCGFCNTPGPVVVISADGQDPVELIPVMLRKYFNESTEVVIATRESREDSAWRKYTSSLVYSTIRRFGSNDMPLGGFVFFMLGARAKKAILANWQPNTFFQVRVLELGFKREFITYHRVNRKSGVSRWTFSKKLTYMIDGVLGHSFVPIRAISILGLLFSGFSFLLGIFFFISYFVNPTVVKGWTPWNITMVTRSALASDTKCYSVDRATVGIHVTISQDAYSSTTTHEVNSKDFNFIAKSITICDDYWVAAKAVILLCVTICGGWQSRQNNQDKNVKEVISLKAPSSRPCGERIDSDNFTSKL